jgi:Cu/Ag efflux pump CusA
MLNRIIEFSLKNRFLILVLTAILIGSGIYSAIRLPIDAVPDLTNIQVQILTNAPALGPLEVEQFITFPVERAMSGLPRVEEIRSVSKFGLSAVTVVFEEGVDIYWARQLIMERMSEARDDIPEGYGTPEMAPISTGLGEIYQFEVRGEGYSPMELRTILDWYVGYQLKTVQGVVEVNTFGGELKTYEVQLDPDKLVNFKVPINKVFEALQRNNANAGGGYMVHHGEQRLVRGEGLVQSLQDIENIVVDSREDGTPIFIRDVAAAVLFAPMIRQGAVTRDGRGEIVSGITMMLMGENSRVVVDRVKRAIEQIKKTLPKGVTIDTYYDRTELVRKTILTVLKNLSEGGLLVIAVLFLLLGNVRAGLVVAFAIPLAMLFAVDMMLWWGIAGSLMSLGAIDFGLVVDSSVIMIENCVRRLAGHREEGGEQRVESGVPAETVSVGIATANPAAHVSSSSPTSRSIIEVVRDAAIEVRKPTMFGELIIAIVYLPILTLTGMAGKLFRPMALTVIFALAGSLVLSLTLMPVLASFALRRATDPRSRVTHWCRSHRIITSILIAAVSLSVPLVVFLAARQIPLATTLQPWKLLPLLGELHFEELLLMVLMPAVLFALALGAILLGGPVQEKDMFLIRWAKAIYEPALRQVLKHPVITFGTTVAIFAVSLGAAMRLGGEFMPKLDEGSLALQAWRLPSISLEQSVVSTGQIERVLKAFPEVTTVVSKTGRPEIATDPMGVEISDIIVMLKSRDEWTTMESPESLAQVMAAVLEEKDPAKLRQKAEEIFAELDERNLRNPKDRLRVAMDELLKAIVPGNIFSYSQPIELRVSELIAGVRSELGISLYGDDLKLLKENADKIVAVVQRVDGAVEVKVEQVAGLPVLRVKIRRGDIARYGINAADVLDAVSALGGHVVGQAFEGQQRYALQVRFAPYWREDLEKIKHIKVADPQGRQIPLEQLADLTVEEGPAQISRANIRRRITIECNVLGRDIASFVADAQQRVDEQVKLPPGYTLHWGGQFEHLISASKRLAVVVPLALGLIFVLLYTTFNSMRLAMLIYLAVPMAAIGGIFALLIRGMPFSISAGVGFIALFGVAVLNGLVLVSYTEGLRRRGLETAKAAFEAAIVRMRPVLMTALVASLGFLPMALSTSEGAEVQRPLATVVIGGLISSTLLTLLVLPTIYHWFAPRVAEVEV